MSGDVYFHFGHHNEILYVGTTTRGFTRQGEHARSKPWWRDVARVECLHYESASDARAVEETMIRLLRPTHNVVHNSAQPPRLVPKEMTQSEVELMLALERKAELGILLASEQRTLDKLRAMENEKTEAAKDWAQRALERLAARAS
jgi:excinuclease UvrABC nuclease subunit